MVLCATISAGESTGKQSLTGCFPFFKEGLLIMRFYHLTAEDIATTIFEQGTLKASYGSNNLLCNEAKPYVFFCDEESVPY